MEIYITLMGLLTGFLVGLTGVGGAALLTPALVLSGVPPTLAVGTDLAYNSVTKLFGTWQHLRHKTVRREMVFSLAIGSVPGAVTAFIFFRLFKTTGMVMDAFLTSVLGVVLILVSAAIAIHLLIERRGWLRRLQSGGLEGRRGWTALIGFVLGLIVGLTSVGSGSLFTLAMMLAYRMKAAELVGTDIAHAFILVTISGILHASMDNVDYAMVLNLVIGSVPGVLAGSRLSAKFPPKPLRLLMACLIGISGIELL